MLRVHLASGETLRFDLSDEDQAREWRDRAGDRAFQLDVRGLTVQHNGVQYSLTRPEGFGRVFLYAERLAPDEAQKFKGGERLVLQAGDVRLTMMVHEAQRAARVSLTKTGAVVYNPLEQRRG